MLLQLHILNCPPPVSVSYCTAHACATVPFNRYASTTARGSQPAQSEWYYSHDISKGLGAILNIMSLDSASTVNITIEYAPDAIDASAFNGVSPPSALCVLALYLFLCSCTGPSGAHFSRRQTQIWTGVLNMFVRVIVVLFWRLYTKFILSSQVNSWLHYSRSGLHLHFGIHWPIS